MSGDGDFKLQTILGDSFVDKDGQTHGVHELDGLEAVLVYFSAHWCPPCRTFTPQLVQTYNKLKADGKRVELIFVSNDRDVEAFNNYFSSMPWLAIPYEDGTRRRDIATRFRVEGIPTLVVLDGAGEVITTDGRTAVSSDPEGASFPWGDFKKPEFTLDDLKHTDPMPGPIWRDRTFLALFCDAMLENAEMEGGDRKKFGDISAVIEVLWHISTRVVDTHRAWLPSISDDDLDKLHTANTLMRGSVNMARLASKVQKPEDLANFLKLFGGFLKNLEDGKRLVLPGGWREMDTGQAVMYTVLRTGETFSFFVHNTGKGITYHPSTAVDAPKMKYQTTIRISNIPRARMLDDVVWYFFWKIQVAQSDDHRAEVLYEMLLPYLAGKPLAHALAESAEEKDESDLVEFCTPQRSQTNYLQPVLEAFRYSMRSSGLSREQVKQVMFAIRLEFLAHATTDIHEVRALMASDAKLIKTACQQTARHAVKQAEKGHLNGSELKYIHDIVKDLEQLVAAREQSDSSIPLLLANEKDNWLPMSNFDLIPRSEGVEPFAGWKNLAPKFHSCDFTRIPRVISSFNSAIDAIKTCQDLCEQMAKKQSSGSYFFRCSLIQSLFTEVIPMPLPMSWAKSNDDVECIWQSATIDYVTQVSTLNLLSDIARHYASAAKSVKVNPSFQAAQGVVMAAILCISDAVLRIHASDNCSMVTMVLNGTEFLRAAREIKEENEGDADAGADGQQPDPQQQQQPEGPKSNAGKTTNMDFSRIPGATAQFYLSIKTGGGREFKEYSEKMQLATPELVMTRSALIDYFDDQERHGSKSVFNFPTKMNATTYLGKDGPTLDLVKQLCLLLGYELTPDDEKEDTMDDAVSFIESATFYLINDQSPLVENHPEFKIYRDLVMLYKLVLADTTHRRSIKLHRWMPHHANLFWRIKEVNRAKTMVDLNVGGFNQPALIDDCKAIVSPADLEVYMEDVKWPTEDDVLHLKNVPNFDDTLSDEDSEQLLSYLTVPYLRVPLICKFFASKDRISTLLNRDLQKLVEAVIFEPRRWISGYQHAQKQVTTVPCIDETLLGTPSGMLLNELFHAPDVFLSSLLDLGRLAIELNTGSYRSTSRSIILFAMRLLSRVEIFINYALGNQERLSATAQGSASKIEQNRVVLEGFRRRTRSFLEQDCGKILAQWEKQAHKYNDLEASCMIHAHASLLYRGLRPEDLNADNLHALLSHLAFLQTWYSPGLGQGEADAISDERAVRRTLASAHSSFGGEDGLGRGGMGMGITGRGIVSFGSEEDEEKKGGPAGSDADTEAKGKGNKEKDEDKAPGLGDDEEGKDLPLRVPDQEVFDLMQLLRVPILEWFEKASQEDTNRILTAMLCVATRTPPTTDFGTWSPRPRDGDGDGSSSSSATPGFERGVYMSSDGDIEVNAQTAEIYFRSSHIQPVANHIARDRDFGTVFGNEPQHCALVARHDNRVWVRLVGKSYNLKRWEMPEKDVVPLNSALPIDEAEVVGDKPTEWRCFGCSKAYPMEAQGCDDCKRDKPRHVYGVKHGTLSYPRLYIQENLAPHERWIFEVLEPVILTNYGKRPKMKYEIYLPATTEDGAASIRVLGQDKETWKEFHVIRERSIVHVFGFTEHGRRTYRSQIYTSNTRFCLSHMKPDTKDRAWPWHPSVRYGAGSLTRQFNPAPSLVISRDHHADDVEETFMPKRLLEGIVPSALLDNFFFYQRDGDDSLRGYPKDLNSPQWHYRVDVTLVNLSENHPQVADASNPVRAGWHAVISRCKLRDEDIAEEGSGKNFFNIKKQLDPNDPLVAAINKSKLSTLTDQGYGVRVAEQVLSTFDYDLPLAQAWLADAKNQEELERIRNSASESDAAIAADGSNGEEADIVPDLPELPLVRQLSRRSRQLVLLNLVDAPRDSPLYRLAEVITRIEDLSHVLAWTSSDVVFPNEQVNMSLIELPRLKLKLQPRTDENGVVRLYSLDHADLFISDFRDELVDRLVKAMPHSILMEDSGRELSLLIPNIPVHRPTILRCPFSTELVMDRGDPGWQEVMDARFFLYPLHISHSFLTTPTQGSAVYLILLLMLNRHYVEAFRVVQSCEADMKLSESDAWLLQELEKAAHDHHPNAHACRLKLSLVMMHCGEKYPWHIQDEYKQYLAKYNMVSDACRISADEEIYLLKHVRSGAEFEELEDEHGKDELEYKPQFLDTELSNRLAYLLAQSGERDSAEPLSGSSSDMRLDQLKDEVFVQNKVQRGDALKWNHVELAANRFYRDFGREARTWYAQVEYDRPSPDKCVVGPGIKTVNAVWKDTITGLGRQKGFMFIVDLLVGNIRMSLCDPHTDNSFTLAKLLAQLLFLKNTSWGARLDLDVHRSYRERSYVPYVVIALLIHYKEKQIDLSLPTLDFARHRFELVRGVSVSNRDDNRTVLATYLDQLLEALRPLATNEVRLAEIKTVPITFKDLEKCQVAPLATVRPLPEVVDYTCSKRLLRNFKVDGKNVTFDDKDRLAFSVQPLSPIGLEQFIVFVSQTKISGDMKFNVQGHPDSLSHVAQELLTRLNADVKNYQQMVNEGKQPRIVGLLDTDIASIITGDANKPRVLGDALGQISSLISSLEELREVDQSQVPDSMSFLLDHANQVTLKAGVTPATSSTPSAAPAREEEKKEEQKEKVHVQPSAVVDPSFNEDKDRYQYLLSRFSGQYTEAWLDFVTACLLSSDARSELLKLNPFLAPGAETEILECTATFCLRLNRIGHINRCIALATHLRSLLKTFENTSPRDAEERSVQTKNVLFKSTELARALGVSRYSMGRTAGFTDDDLYEPRYLVFEYLFNILLRGQQVQLLRTFIEAVRRGDSKVEQMIMGAGKTTVIGPLLALIFADGAQLVTQVVPSALLEFSRSVMRSRFTRVISKRIHTFSFDRTVKRVRNITRLFDKLDAARKTRGVVVTTPEAIKSLMLKHLELLHQMEEAPAKLSEQAQRRLRVKSEMADQLARVMTLWQKGVLFMDEVDLLLHPLRSELNFPIGAKKPLDLSPHRWELPIHLLEAVFFTETGILPSAFRDSSTAHAVLLKIKKVIEYGIRNRFLQTSPHLVLLDQAFYFDKLKPLLAAWVLLWLRAKGFVEAGVPDDIVKTFLINGPTSQEDDAALFEISQQVLLSHRTEQKKMLNLAHDWLHSFAPHVLSKINRVSYGLLTKEDMQQVDPNMPPSRKYTAVPFVGKDVPSRASEFAHPDVLIGLTVLAYRYEGMRRTDVRRVVQQLQRDLKNEVGPQTARPSSVLFQSFLDKGIVFQRVMRRRDRERELRYIELKRQLSGGSDLSLSRSNSRLSTFSDGSASGAGPSASSDSLPVATRSTVGSIIAGTGADLDLPDIMPEDGPTEEELEEEQYYSIVPLPIFQLSDQFQVDNLFRRVGRLPDLIHHYLELMIFPAVMQHQVLKLSASGQELGGGMLFKTRLGFSGTPSDLMPLELGECGYERGSEGKITNVLTDPKVVSYTVQDEWSVEELLMDIAVRDPPAHALIDTGALITGMSNLEVARFLLDNGLPTMEGVVFLDRLDRQVILLRSTGKVIPLSQCGLAPSKRFSFYDQVHTTGMDIKQGLNACAILTLGKDMTFRDYSQGAFRMRGIGVGQTIHLFIIPEVAKLIQKEVRRIPRTGGDEAEEEEEEKKRGGSGRRGRSGKFEYGEEEDGKMIADVAAWLTINSMRSEKLQFMQLCIQNLANVWRKTAHRSLLAETVDPEEDPRRYWRFAERANDRNIMWLKRCIHVFREKIDFSVQSDIQNTMTFSDGLKKRADEHSVFFADDEGGVKAVETVHKHASGAGSESGLLKKRMLNAEMVTEQEAEKQKDKRVQQEQQVQIRFSREDEDQIPWPILQLASFSDLAAKEAFEAEKKAREEEEMLEMQRQAAMREAEEIREASLKQVENEKPFVNPTFVEQLMLAGFTFNQSERAVHAVDNAGADPAMMWLLDHLGDPDIDTPLPPKRAAKSSSSSSSTATTPAVSSSESSSVRPPLRAVTSSRREAHAFYKFNQFSLRGLGLSDIHLPDHVLLSHNYFRPEWAAMGQRRLKNIAVVLEWIPQEDSKEAPPSGGLTRSSSSSSSPLDLSPAQEQAIETAFRMFDFDKTGRIRTSEVKSVLWAIGETPSDAEVEEAVSELDPSGSGGVSKEAFRSLVTGRHQDTLSTKDKKKRRYFVCLSLAEAQTLRRIIHQGHAILTNKTHPVGVALRLLSGDLLDSSVSFSEGSSGQESLATQCFRFVNCEYFFSDSEVSLLLRALSGNKQAHRQAFFENVLRCRRRDRNDWTGTPLAKLFTLPDEYHFLAHRAKIVGIRNALQRKGLLLRDAFNTFDAVGDNMISQTELSYALEWLGLSLSDEEVGALFQHADTNDDGLLDVGEFSDIFRDPHEAAPDAQEALEKEMSDMRKCGVKVRAFERLTLSPAFVEKYHAEQTTRRERLSRLEAERIIEAEKKAEEELREKREAEEAARLWKERQAELAAIAALQKETHWNCPQCTFKNEIEKRTCGVCDYEKPEEKESGRGKEDVDTSDDEEDEFDPPFWTCGQCTVHNPRENRRCELCNASKPEVVRYSNDKMWSCPNCTKMNSEKKKMCVICDTPNPSS